MLLRLTPNNPFQTVLSEVSSLDSANPAGASLYNVNTASTIFTSTSTVSRIVDGDGLAELATFHRKAFRGTVIDYGGKSMTVDKFLTHTKWFSTGRSFDGPDGKHYTWHGANKLTVGQDKSEVMVACFHAQKRFPKQQAHLEINESGSHMLDHIVVTWIFLYALVRAQNGAPAAPAPPC